MRLYSLVVAVLAAAWIASDVRAVAGDDPIADVHEREAEFHAVCDKWEAVAAAGDDTVALEAELKSAYLKLIMACEDANLPANNVLLLLDQVAWAGKLVLPSKAEVSCMIGKGQTGLVVAVWHRAPWEKHLPPHGINGGFGIAPINLFDEFNVAAAKWEDEKKTLMRVPYSIQDAKGFIEIRRDGEQWKMHPDRGRLDGKWWQPFPK